MTGEIMKVNLNKMGLNSVAAFFSINGKFSAGEKDCYFLRCIGFDDEKKDAENLLSCEKRFIAAVSVRKAGYYRTDRLPFNASPDAVSKYSQTLGKLSASGQSAATRSLPAVRRSSPSAVSWDFSTPYPTASFRHSEASATYR